MLDIGILRFKTKNMEWLWMPPDLVIRVGYIGIFVSIRKKKNTDAAIDNDLQRIQKVRHGDADPNSDNSSAS